MSAEPKKAPWPKSNLELTAQGYIFSGRGVCKGCHAPIVWATTPNQKRMPLSKVAGTESTYEPHWASCEKRADFKRDKK